MSASVKSIFMWLIMLPAFGPRALPQTVADRATGLRAGVARIDITPDIPVALEGYLEPENRVSTGVHDRLYVRAFGFENGGKRLVLVSCDLATFMSAPYFRGAIQARFNLRPDELFLCAVHTHSAPQLALNRSYPHPSNFAYTEIVRARLLEAVGQALSTLAPARIAVGRGRLSVGVNRRKKRPDGQVEMAPNPDGPADPEVLALAVTGADGACVASLFSYACHARALRGTNRLISGDIFGIAEQFAEKQIGAKHVSGGFAGASGDIDPVAVVSGFGEGPGDDNAPVRQGSLLGAEVVRAVRNARDHRKATGQIRSASAQVMLPSKTEGQTKPVEVIAARIGEVAFLGLNCEALVEVGLAIKAASPYRNTFVLTICNGWAGYLPPAHRYPEGGYEVDRSGFGPAAADILVRRSVALLDSLR